MARTIKHVVLRDGVYQYQRRVPKKVIDRPVQFASFFGGNPQFRKSLGTRDQGEALKEAYRVRKEFERRVNGALEQAVAHPTVRPITEKMLLDIRGRQTAAVLRPYRLHLVYREQDPRHNEELQRMFEHFEQDAERIQNSLIDLVPTDDPSLDVNRIAEDIIGFEGIDAPLGSTARSLVNKAVREGLVEGYRQIGRLMDGTQSVLQDEGRRLRTKAPRLSEIVATHAAAVNSRRTKVEIDTALRDFISLIGDLPIDEITKSNVRRFCEHEGAKTVGGRSRNSVARPMSSGNLQKKVGLLRAAVNRSIQRGIFEGVNPFAGINVAVFTTAQSASVMPDKRPFETDELNRIFAYPWFTGCASATDIHRRGDYRLSGMHYWAPVLALLTGCRAGELGGLMLDEVRIDDRMPHIIIRDNKFRTTKKHYQRKIPLLDQLMDLGFADFVAAVRSKGEERLLSDWLAPGGRAETDDPSWSNAAVIRSFNQTLIPKALTGMLMPGARREVTFHSFRGAFKRLLGLQRYGIQANYVHEVVGHEKFHLDARYVREIPLEETYPAIRKCRYEGLVIPPPS